jgi:hypothetical protein
LQTRKANVLEQSEYRCKKKWIGDKPKKVTERHRNTGQATTSTPNTYAAAEERKEGAGRAGREACQTQIIKLK